MANGKYYIEPGANYGQGLAGFGQALMQAQQFRRQQEEQAKQQQIADMQRIKGQHLDAIYEGLANPESIPQLAIKMGAKRS